MEKNRTERPFGNFSRPKWANIFVLFHQKTVPDAKFCLELIPAALNSYTSVKGKSVTWIFDQIPTKIAPNILRKGSKSPQNQQIKKNKELPTINTHFGLSIENVMYKTIFFVLHC